MWLARRHVPESRDESRTGHPDVLGSVVGALGLAGVVGALVEAPVRGADPLVVTAAVVGLSGLTAFVLLQLRGREPLVPPSLFADRTFVLSNALTFLVYAALGGVMVLGGLMALGVDNRVLGAATEHHDPHSCPVDSPPART